MTKLIELKILKKSKRNHRPDMLPTTEVPNPQAVDMACQEPGHRAGGEQQAASEQVPKAKKVEDL